MADQNRSSASGIVLNNMNAKSYYQNRTGNILTSPASISAAVFPRINRSGNQEWGQPKLLSARGV
jgi:hypothetical protein